MKIGNYTVPPNPFRLPKLIEDIKKVYDTYKGDPIKNPNKNDTLAQLLGYKSSNNGQYWNELAAMRIYGLVEGRGDVKVSDLAKQLTYGESSQKGEAALKAFFNISLWKELHGRYRFDLPKQDFWAKLQNIADCEAPDAKSNERFVYKAFSDDAKVLETVKTYSLGEDEMMPIDQQMQGVATPQYIEIKAGPYFHRLPFTAQGKKVALEALQLIEVPDTKPSDRKT